MVVHAWFPDSAFDETDDWRRVSVFFALLLVGTLGLARDRELASMERKIYQLFLVFYCAGAVQRHVRRSIQLSDMHMPRASLHCKGAKQIISTLHKTVFRTKSRFR